MCSPLKFYYLNIVPWSQKSEADCMDSQISLVEDKLLKSCFRPKKAPKFDGTTVQGCSTTKKKPEIEFSFDHISISVIVQKERYIVSTTDFICSVGGLLGFFLGFSCFTYMSDFIDKIL